MAELVPFRLHLTGDEADEHQFQGYDGYMALAGFAWTLSLVSNYVETGKIRHRGEFPGRYAVLAAAPSEGSVIADFQVWLQSNPAVVFGLPGALASALMLQLVKRVIDRNLGDNDPANSDLLTEFLAYRAGAVEALVASTEPSIRQAHSVIGNGVKSIGILSGHNIINTFDEQSRDYVKLNVEDRGEIQKDFSVAAFNVNSGHGSVFDFDLGRTVPISMSRDVLRNVSSVFTWGLNEYANKTGKKVTVRFWRILAMDNTPKRYVVLKAERAEDR